MKNHDNIEINEIYDAVFDGIKAPEKLYGKVISMKKTKNRRVNGMKKVAVIFALAIAVIFGSNAIVYAATGTGWIGRIVVQWTGSTNEQQEVKFVEEKNPNGEIYYIGTVQNEKQDSVTITTKDMDVLKGKTFRVEDGTIYVTFEDGTEKKIEVYNQEEGFTVGMVRVTPLPEKP